MTVELGEAIWFTTSPTKITTPQIAHGASESMTLWIAAAFGTRWLYLELLLFVRPDR